MERDDRSNDWTLNISCMSQLCGPCLMHSITRNISISAAVQTKERKYLFPKGRQFHLRSKCSLSCDCTAVFLRKRNHEFLLSTIFNYKQTPKPICAIPAECSTEEPQLRQGLGAFVQCHKYTFSIFVRKTSGQSWKTHHFCKFWV